MKGLLSSAAPPARTCVWVQSEVFLLISAPNSCTGHLCPWTQQPFPTREPVGGSEVTQLPALSLVKHLPEKERLEKPAACALWSLPAPVPAAPVHHGWPSRVRGATGHQEEKRCLSRDSVARQGVWFRACDAFAAGSAAFRLSGGGQVTPSTCLPVDIKWASSEPPPRVGLKIKYGCV